MVILSEQIKVRSSSKTADDPSNFGVVKSDSCNEESKPSTGSPPHHYGCIKSNLIVILKPWTSSGS